LTPANVSDDDSLTSGHTMYTRPPVASSVRIAAYTCVAAALQQQQRFVSQAHHHICSCMLVRVKARRPAGTQCTRGRRWQISANRSIHLRSRQHYSSSSVIVRRCIETAVAACLSG
jgi:hypothetical protein